MAERQDLIEVEELCLSRGGREVLRDVTAAFRAETVTAVVGPSGSGKSSLLRCLNRLEEPAGGRVLIEGRDVREVDPIALRKKVGMIFQTPVLFEGGVETNLRYGLDGVSQDELAGALVGAGLAEDFLSRSSTALSVGQAQRVCIARALIRGPEVLLMDEPTSALDRDATRTIEELVVEIGAGGMTTVLVTHDLHQAQRVADHAYLMRDGRIVGSGPPDRLDDMWSESS